MDKSLDLNLSSPSTQLLFSTTRIIAKLPDGESVGTAFFFNFKVDDERILPVLITNKHVVQGANTGEFLVHQAMEDSSGGKIPAGESVSVTVDAFADRWIGHPGEVDLCAMPIEGLRQQLLSAGKTLFSIPLDEALIPANEALRSLTALEDVSMVGYPIGLWDQVNNLPLLRRGITATHPAVDFNGMPLGAADIAAFPGSSGSPILILNQGSYATPNGMVIGSRALLLGVLAAGPQYTAQGALEIVDIPTADTPILSTKIPIHLGYYVKAKELTVLKERLLSELVI